MTNILSGAEPLSVAAGATGVLAIHGFTGGPHSMHPVAAVYTDLAARVDQVVVAGLSMGGSPAIWLERSYHVATLDYEADETIEATRKFVAGL